jgi:hypothetical protein
MSHVVFSEIAAAIDIQTGAVVSRVIFRDDRTDVTVFGFDAGEGLTEHQAFAPNVPLVMPTMQQTGESPPGAGLVRHVCGRARDKRPSPARHRKATPAQALAQPRRGRICTFARRSALPTVEALTRKRCRLNWKAVP